MKQAIINFYLEYVNDFLTITGMASYYDMPEDDVYYLITTGKKWHEQKVELNKLINN